MLKANEAVSQKNKEIINTAIAQATGVDNYKVLYGYSMKNLLVIELVSHFAIAYNDNEFVLLQINKDGSSKGEAKRYQTSDKIKFSLHGKLVLENESGKMKIEVPGMVPSVIGTKQLGINQMPEMGQMVKFITELGKKVS